REGTVVQALGLKIREVELICDQTRGDVPGEPRVALDVRELARTAAFIGRPVALTDPERELGVVIEEERGDVVVVDVKQDVGLFLGKPLLDRLVALEDRRPDRIVLLVRIQRKADGRRMRGCDSTDNRRHAYPSKVR